MSGRVKTRDVLFCVLLVACVAAAVVFGVPGIISYGDDYLSRLVCDSVPRFAVAIALIAVIVRTGRGDVLKAGSGELPRAMLWSLPCFAVAFANFPYSAIARGAAVIVRTDLIPLFLFKCLSIALSEELFFRAVLVPFAAEATKKYRFGTTLAVISSSAIFAAVHFINLFFGMGVGDVFLQIGYTFLIGCMLALTLLVTKNVWICVAVHFLFDTGGTIVADIGVGTPWDTVFWILTAIASAICTAHCVIALVRLERTEKQRRSLSTQPSEHDRTDR